MKAVRRPKTSRKATGVRNDRKLLPVSVVGRREETPNVALEAVEMNIFETIGRVTHRIEPFHSQFLADALSRSLEGDRSLFDAVWKLAAPLDWEVPGHARVVSEQAADGGRRIDVCLSSDLPRGRVVGIEVKTVAVSAEFDQLERYLYGLRKEFPGCDVQVSYLTPFNRRRAGPAAESLKTVRAFDDFARVFPQARHISWLDIADVPWDGNELWRQHQEYVRKRMSSHSRLENLESGRDFADFFGEEASEKFRNGLQDLGIKLGIDGTTIDLRRYQEDESFAASLTSALKTLLGADQVSRNANRPDKFGDGLRCRFLDSPHREIHQALFNLSRTFPYVWVEGKHDYGIRTAHEGHPSGVSLLTSRGPDRLVIGKRR